MFMFMPWSACFARASRFACSSGEMYPTGPSDGGCPCWSPGVELGGPLRQT
jgi:hypothetical protein